MPAATFFQLNPRVLSGRLTMFYCEFFFFKKYFLSDLKIGVDFDHGYKLELFFNFLWVINMEWKRWKHFFVVLLNSWKFEIQLQVEIWNFMAKCIFRVQFLKNMNFFYGQTPIVYMFEYNFIWVEQLIWTLVIK